MSYGLVRTRYHWTFSKILISSCQTIDFCHLYIAHVLLFTLAVCLFRSAPPCGCGLAFCWPRCNTGPFENYHYQSHIVKFLLDNTIIHKKLLNLNTTECVFCYTYTTGLQHKFHCCDNDLTCKCYRLYDV